MWTTTPDGKCYLNGKFIAHPKAYGAKMRRAFLRREREADDRRPIHFSLDIPINPRYSKPILPNRRDSPRANLWGMPLADDEPLRPFEFYERRMQLFIEYARQYTQISKREAEWLLRMLWWVYKCVKENRENGKKAVREALSDAVSVVVNRGRLAKFVGLYQDVAATPGWYAISHEGATIAEALAINRAARYLWKHPRPIHLREGFRFFTPKRAHRRKKK